MAVTEELAKRLRSMEKRVKQLETRMIANDELDSLIESVESITENPTILREIDEALSDFREGRYYMYEQVFGEKLRRTR